MQTPAVTVHYTTHSLLFIILPNHRISHIFTLTFSHLFTRLHYSTYLDFETESLRSFHPEATLTRLSDIRRLKV